MVQINCETFPDKPNLTDKEIHIWIVNLDKVVIRGQEIRLALSGKIRTGKYHYNIHRDGYTTQYALR